MLAASPEAFRYLAHSYGCRRCSGYLCLADITVRLPTELEEGTYIRSGDLNTARSWITTSGAAPI